MATTERRLLGAYHYNGDPDDVGVLEWTCEDGKEYLTMLWPDGHADPLEWAVGGYVAVDLPEAPRPYIVRCADNSKTYAQELREQWEEAVESL